MTRNARTAAIAAALVLLTRGASAQVRWAVDRYNPAPAGDPFVGVDHPRYGGARTPSVSAALRFGYALEPLVARTQGAAPRAVIAHAGAMYLGVAARFERRMEFDLAVPISLGESGTRDPSGAGPFAAPAVGDLRLGARVRLAGDADGRASLHLGVQLFAGFLGTAPAAANVSDGWARGRVTLITAGRAGIVRWSFTAGAHARPTTTVAGGVVAASELQMAAAVGVELAGGRVMVGPEAWFATPFADPFRYGSSAAEALLAARVRLPRGFSLNLAAGPGLLGGAGVPNLRALTSLTWEPTPAR